ncbi:MAG TPA: CDGSH iron-sulfur domain-containing protein [Burkholderiaceae bacterium]|nr:CDGSH iron-sulfur domain-containing protein [Burkholderiaceae bacterium]
MAVKDYAARDLIVSYDATKCIHAKECVRGAPAVFDPDARPWIRPANGELAEIAAVVRRCPTGALTVRRVDGSPVETADATNNLSVTPNGPLYLRGRVVFEGGEQATQVEYMRVALCRCGQSKNKPLCDGSHEPAGFADPGRCTGPPDDATPGQPTGAVNVKPIRNGPLMLQGWIEFKAADGSTFVAGEKTWLCRCGQSSNKPFCDGTHKKVGFAG